MELDLFKAEELPPWFEYPKEFNRLVESEIFVVEPWQILEGKWLRVRHEGLKKRYPDRDLIPFYRCLANDDVACWDKNKPGKVVIVYDFASPGWEAREEFDTFWDWFRSIIEHFIEYE
ncbi:hypothetical protein [Vreelandella titanicae]|uniref:hypothetical protein n=1 Tax=Vreelandella titanicae TaxID=664683 RepID=UPI0011438629|nr:hypothetical protein [Halomonas titanicae]